MQNIETLRVIATFLLIAYHVIGVGQNGGMQVANDSGWRLFSDFLIDLRMPMFAFIAGAVYALRPIVLNQTAKFMTGKFRRLVIPGVTASILFWLLGNSAFITTFTTGAPFLENALLANGHFWFLQAILIIFLLFGFADALLGYRYASAFLLVSVALTLAWSALPIPQTGYLRFKSAIYLMPYFIVGVLLVREQNYVARYRHVFLGVAIALTCIGLVQNFHILTEYGRLSRDRFDLQSLNFGIGAVTLLYLAFPSISWVNRFGIYTFTIYLYHPLGTSAARRVFDLADVNMPVLNFTVGVLVGALVPLVVHLAASRSMSGSQILLGLKPAPKVENLREATP